MITILKNGKRVKKFYSSTKNFIKYVEKLTGTSIDNINFKKDLSNYGFYVNDNYYLICYC